MNSLVPFFKIAGHNNSQGYYDFAFLPEDELLSLPDEVNGCINFDNAVLATDKKFLSGYGTLSTLDLGDDNKQGKHGGTTNVEFSGSAPLVNNLNLSLFNKKRQRRFILLLRDNNGTWFVAGEPGNGLIFEFKRGPSSLEFSYKATYNHPCWQVTGEILVDGELIDTGEGSESGGGGGGGGGGIVIVKRSDGTVISNVTAPDSYTVADSTITVKNTEGTTVATDSVKANSSKNVTAPNGTAVVKNTAGTTLSSIGIPSGKSENISVADASVFVKNSDNTVIANENVKSGVSSDIEVPDTSIQLKDQEGTNIGSSEDYPSGVSHDIIVPVNFTEMEMAQIKISLLQTGNY